MTSTTRIFKKEGLSKEANKRNPTKENKPSRVGGLSEKQMTKKERYQVLSSRKPAKPDVNSKSKMDGFITQTAIFDIRQVSSIIFFVSSRYVFSTAVVITKLMII